jgi:hypothetical protein
VSLRSDAGLAAFIVGHTLWKPLYFPSAPRSFARAARAMRETRFSASLAKRLVCAPSFQSYAIHMTIMAMDKNSMNLG